MGEETEGKRGRRLSEDQMRARRERIFARLRRGAGYAEIAAEEGLTARRIRQIVSEARRERELREKADFEAIETGGLPALLRCAGHMVANGDRVAIRFMLDFVERIERRIASAHAPVAAGADGSPDESPSSRAEALTAGKGRSKNFRAVSPKPVALPSPSC